EYMDRYGELPVTDAVNQETVWSSIDFDSGTFGKNPDEERAYFTDYLSRIKGMGKDVYLLEYTTDKALIKKIAGFCDDRGYTYYASSTLELLAPSAHSSQPAKDSSHYENENNRCNGGFCGQCLPCMGRWEECRTHRCARRL
ncbi:MAG: hypothetical protein IJ080_06660, partial [Oscillospiraceae bacterium]|nr:hypothetical protein [Oscillospiraceae bacterium]